VRESLVTDELSIVDYVLTNGVSLLPCDGCGGALLPGVWAAARRRHGDESFTEDA
jgi:tRNA G37 N-methylase TrmD